MINIAVLLTVHNRKEHTLLCLNGLSHQIRTVNPFDVSIYLMDDGSTDGTAGAVRDNYPQVNICHGSGNLFWNGGMFWVFRKALMAGFDYYLWVNNDTILFTDAMDRLIDTAIQFQNRAIVVGSTQNPETEQWTYGGVIRKHPLRPLKFSPVTPSEYPIPVHTMNGNCVLIPEAVAGRVGNLDPVFTHAMGDFDYGLRARKIGIPIIMAPGYYGFCEPNDPHQKAPTLRTHLKKLFSPKGLPPKDWRVFAKRYAGRFWPMYWLSPYVKSILKRLLPFA
jgi:GT2 family glycosyltransferase